MCTVMDRIQIQRTRKKNRGMVWGGRREEGSGWGTHVCLWRIHLDIWQNQYNIVKFKNKIKFFKKEKKNSILLHQEGRGREVQRNLYRLPCHFK